MELTNLTLAYQLKDFSPHCLGSFIQKFQQIQENVYKLKLHTKTGNQELLVILPSTLYLTNLKLPTMDQKGFQKNLSDALENQKILSISQHFFDRVVEVQTPKYFLIFELFADGNIILCDSEHKIVRVLRKEEWSTRTLKHGEQYIFPPAKKLQPLHSEFEEFFGALKSFDKDIARFLIMECNSASPVSEEILHELKVDKTTLASKITEKQAKLIFQKMNEFYSLKAQAKPVLMKEKAKEFLLPFPLPSKKEFLVREFDSFSSAFDSLFQAKFNQSLQEKDSQTSELTALQESLNKQLELKVEFEKQMKESEKKANFIYENFSEIQDLIQAIERAKVKKITQKEMLEKLKQHSKIVKDVQLKKSKLILNF